MTTEFFDIDKFSNRIYHCVDEIKAQPGMPVQTIEAAEAELAKNVDIIFATSPQLAKTRKIWNLNTHYMPNVADYQHFSTALLEKTVLPPDLANIPEPRLGFIGAISGYKIDFNLIRQIAENRPDWSIVMIGEVGEGDPWTDSNLLNGLTNLHLIGPRPYKDLPGYLKGFDVALLPNNINEYTDSMFPMKFFEYLSAGCPVVSVDLKAIREFSSVVSIASNAAEFIHAIDNILMGNGPSLSTRLGIARQYTYEARTSRMLEMLKEMDVS
jgi:glycosyltransferase involved in cell wall biosynthesis